MATKSNYRHIKREVVNRDGDMMLKRGVDFLQLEPLSEGEEDDGIRVYGGHACGTIQLRGISPITRGGKPRRMIATASYLDKREVTALIERLTEMRDTLQD